MEETRKQSIFKWQKRLAEAKGEPFPYSDYDEWDADSENRRQKWLEYANQKHKWLEAGLFSDEIFYNFFDPESNHNYTVTLRQSSGAEYWSADLTCADNEDYCRVLTPLFHGTYDIDELPYLKIDLIRCLETLFPAVSGWNDEFLKPSAAQDRTTQF